MHKIIFALIITLLYLLRVDLALASEFTTEYRATYELNVTGSTAVTHSILLRNNLSHIFPRDYTLSVGNTSISNVQVHDLNNQPLPFKSEQSGNQTNISLSLSNPSIGLSQENQFFITYQTDSVTTHTGNVWEINIPRLKQGSQMAIVERTIIFPSELGSPTASYPTPDTVQSNKNKTIVTYSTSRQEAISLLFGETQYYELELDYYLDAPLTKNSQTEISLPSDTPYQKIVLDSIDPKPSHITVDLDGNWLARYNYKDNFETHVKVKLFVQISPVPIFDDPSQNHLSLLKSSKFWQTDHSLVKQIGEQLKTPKNIYDYLVERFSYNTNRVMPGADRLGAVQALEKPALAICTEFTDSFVALARSQGIPSREINGLALTNNSDLRPLSLETDVLHSWPEYYDKDKAKWIQVDPTWGHTTGGINYFNKLDYNHITFVRHGIEPTYPYPAGVYKKSRDDKTISVKVLDQMPEVTAEYEVESLAKNIYLIKNTGKIALSHHTVPLPNGASHTVLYLPPYGQLDTSSVLGSQDTKVPVWIYAVASLSALGISVGIYLYLTSKGKAR